MELYHNNGKLRRGSKMRRGSAAMRILTTYRERLCGTVDDKMLRRVHAALEKRQAHDDLTFVVARIDSTPHGERDFRNYLRPRTEPRYCEICCPHGAHIVDQSILE